jgi:hypothetical protein
MEVGEIYKTNNYGDLKVVNYINNKNVIVEFIDTGYQKTTNTTNIKGGGVKDLMMPSVQGVGYIGVGAYTERFRAYKAWGSMLMRCYCQKYSERQPTYRGCKVDEVWHNFQNFAKWYEHNYRDGYQLDKDLLVVGNRTYSADTCVFVPSSINSFTSDHAASRGDHPLGVHYVKSFNRYVAQCNIGGGRREYLGCFTNPELAHMVWRDRKLSLALGMKPEMDAIDERIYPNVVTIINNSK